MALIELSSGFITSGMLSGYTQRVVNGSIDNRLSLAGLLGTGSNGCQGFLNIYKGSVPINFSSLTSITSRTSDMLLTFDRSASEVLVSFPGNNTALFSTIFKNASASGTATWFQLGTYFNGTNVLWSQFVGTVGTQGSGADMEISSTTVTSGQPYRVISSQITLPTSWTY